MAMVANSKPKKRLNSASKKWKKFCSRFFGWLCCCVCWKFATFILHVRIVCKRPHDLYVYSSSFPPRVFRAS